jgi:hypothetical protein
MLVLGLDQVRGGALARRAAGEEIGKTLCASNGRAGNVDSAEAGDRQGGGDGSSETPAAGKEEPPLCAAGAVPMP